MVAEEEEEDVERRRRRGEGGCGEEERRSVAWREAAKVGQGPTQDSARVVTDIGHTMATPSTCSETRETWQKIHQRHSNPSAEYF